MAMIGINPVQSNPRQPSTLEKIATGVDIASKILGTGIEAYKVFGIEQPQAQAQESELGARTNFYNSQANMYGQKLDSHLGPTYRYATDQEKAQGKGYQVPGGDPNQLYVPIREQYWDQVSQRADQKADTQRTGHQENAFYKAQTDLESQRGNAAFRNAQDVLRMVGNAKSIVAPWKDNLDQMPAPQVKLFDAEIAKIATNGVPTESTMKDISDPSLLKNWQQFVSKISDAPAGAGQAQFIPNKLRYLDDLQTNAADLVQGTIDRKLNNWKPHLAAADYDNMRSNWQDYVNKMKDLGNPQSVGAAVAAGSGRPAQTGPRAGDIEDGHRFKGGNAADPANWEVLK